MFKREPLHEPLSDQLRELRERGDGFRLPDNYLAELKDRLPRAEAEEKPAAIVRSLRRYRTWLAVAASVLLVLSLGWGWLSQSAADAATPPPMAEANLDALSDADILAYVEENISDFELSLLYDNSSEAAATLESFSDEDLDELYYELLDEEQ